MDFAFTCDYILEYDEHKGWGLHNKNRCIRRFKTKTEGYCFSTNYIRNKKGNERSCLAVLDVQRAFAIPDRREFRDTFITFYPE